MSHIWPHVWKSLKKVWVWHLVKMSGQKKKSLVKSEKSFILWLLTSKWLIKQSLIIFMLVLDTLGYPGLKKTKTIRLPNHMTDDIRNCFFFVDHFIQRWPSNIFILIRRSILHMQLWRHNKGTYDIIKKITLIPHAEYLPCAKFKFFPSCGFRDTKVQSFPFFLTWLPWYVIYDIIIIIETF